MPGVWAFHITGLPVRASSAVPENSQRWVSDGRPAVCAEKAMLWRAPTTGGTLAMPRIRGCGSSTTTVRITVVQSAAALQTFRVTCLLPGEENVAEGFWAVTVPDWPRRVPADKKSPTMGARGNQPTRRSPTFL